MKEKICILTQPLFTNYGGILQAYALQKTVKELGFDVVTDSCPIKILTKKEKIRERLRRIILRYVLNRKNVSTHPYFLSYNDAKIISKHTITFIDKYISTTDFFQGKILPNRSEIEKYDAFIVGSDQVWRNEYSRVESYFIDFAENYDCIKIAYSASFGKNAWQFDDKRTKRLSFLAKKFTAISVREQSGVDLCKKYLDIDAFHLIDPTLLLNKQDYIDIINQEKEQEQQEDLVTYILDDNIGKQKIIKKIQEINHFSNCDISTKKLDKKQKHIKDEYIFNPVSFWLNKIKNAKFVVTDSFHGTVFAIIFNKPFIVIENEKRGNDRFSSLLTMFNLEDRIIREDKPFDEKILKKEINYQYVDEIIENEKQKAISFLKNNLKF